MRCFIGIELPSYIKDNVFELQKKLNGGFAKIKWVARKNLHLTLKFLGELDERGVKLTEEALSHVKLKRFTVGIGDIGWFPGDSRINVVWLGLKPEKDILNLHGDIELKLGSLFEKDSKFSVHLTVGRVKLVKNRDAFLNRLREFEVKWDSFVVKDFSLIASELTKDGPKYKTLRKYDLL